MENPAWRDAAADSELGGLEREGGEGTEGGRDGGKGGWAASKLPHPSLHASAATALLVT